MGLDRAVPPAIVRDFGPSRAGPGLASADPQGSEPLRIQIGTVPREISRNFARPKLGFFVRLWNFLVKQN